MNSIERKLNDEFRKEIEKGLDNLKEGEFVPNFDFASLYPSVHMLNENKYDSDWLLNAVSKARQEYRSKKIDDLLDDEQEE